MIATGSRILEDVDRHLLAGRFVGNFGPAAAKVQNYVAGRAQAVGVNRVAESWRRGGMSGCWAAFPAS